MFRISYSALIILFFRIHSSQSQGKANSYKCLYLINALCVEGCDMHGRTCTAGHFLVSEWKGSFTNGKYVDEITCLETD
ncbi:hypothetical protein PFISCL1PPCAC_5091, partial [Pristionchus fissidentatus]